MVTISDKRFGELLKNSILLDTYKAIAEGQYEVIQKQEEASRAGMAEIKRLRGELAAVRAELEQSKANLRSSVNSTEYWMKSSDAAKKNYQAAVEAGEYWKEMYDVAFRRAEELKAKVAAILE